MSEPSALPAGSEAASLPDPRLVAAPLVRRMAAFLYEGILLFGIVFATGLVFAVVTHQDNGLKMRTGLLAVQFFVIGVYFIGLWVRSGQTLAMKTWHLRLLTDRGQPLTPRRALARYLASYVWILPPLALSAILRLPDAWAIFGLVGAWIVLYALSALLHPRRQFWHDALCDTAVTGYRAVAPLPQ